MEEIPGDRKGKGKGKAKPLFSSTLRQVRAEFTPQTKRCSTAVGRLLEFEKHFPSFLGILATFDFAFETVRLLLPGSPVCPGHGIIGRVRISKSQSIKIMGILVRRRWSS